MGSSGDTGRCPGRESGEGPAVEGTSLNPDLRGARGGGWKANDHQLSFLVTIAKVSASGPVLASWPCNSAESF